MVAVCVSEYDPIQSSRRVKERSFQRRIRRAVDAPFFFLSSLDFCMSSLMQATRLFFSFVDIRRERRTRGMSSALSCQRCQPIVVSATLELEGKTSLYTE